MQNKKSILITGCSSGIGLETSLFLRKHGFHVIPTARKEKDVTMLKKLGFDALQLDLDDSDSIKKAAKEALRLSRNKLYSIFNNAGFGIPGAIEDLSRIALEKQFQGNVFGHVELTNLLIPSMRKNGQGRIIWKSSVLGLVSMPYRGAYNASKFAIEGIAQALRIELRGSGIFVSLIEPGPITSKFRHNALEQFKQYIPIEKSHHAHLYKKIILENYPARRPTAGTLEPIAVSRKVLHALTSKKPKLHYFVTWPTYAFDILRRFFPARVVDYVLHREIRVETRWITRKKDR